MMYWYVLTVGIAYVGPRSYAVCRETYVFKVQYNGNTGYTKEESAQVKDTTI